VSAENIHDYAAADGFIVGSSLKEGGLWSNPLDPARAQALIRAFAKLPAAKG
jgi:predicted TIM-barrel enzyme